jgi:hypothetical protein
MFYIEFDLLRFCNTGVVSPVELRAMQTALPIHIEMMKQQGKITEKELDNHCIPTSYQGDRRQVPKDKRMLYQNCNRILNNTHVVQ